MSEVKTYKGVLKKLEDTTPEVNKYYWLAKELIETYYWEVPLAWMFSRLELAQNNCLYCAAVKLHRTDTTLTRNAIDAHYLNRKDFRDLYKVIVGKKITDNVLTPLETAEKVRDRVMHGKQVSQADFRQSLVSIIEFSELFNDLVSGHAGFKPFSDLRGFKGAGKSLDKSTTRWILKGMGLLN